MKNKIKICLSFLLFFAAIILHVLFLEKIVLAVTDSIVTGDMTTTVNTTTTSTIISPSLSVAIRSPQSGTEIRTDSFVMEILSPYADYVEVFARENGSTTQRSLGKITTKSTEGIFKKTIQAREEFPNGYWIFFVKATRADQSSGAEVNVKISIPLPETTSTISSTTPIISSTTTSVIRNTSVKITRPYSGAKITSSSFNMEIISPDAEKVELRVKRSGSSNFEYLGAARKNSDGDWEIKVDNLARLPNGRYYFVAKATIGDGLYESGGEYFLDISYIESTAVDSSDNMNQIASTTESATTTQNSSINTADQAESYEGRADSDGDGLSDEKERMIGTNLNSSDTDKDGLSDSDEIRLGTDPKNPDSDRDGFLDGDEMKNGFDPLKYSPGDGSDRMVFENPRERGEVSESYSIEKVEVIQKESDEKRLTLSGRGLPNSFITLYIYSEPIVITVKTDADGNWIYELDKEFEDGEHEAYVAVTDNTGKITVKSEPIRFVKTAEAATIVPNAQAQEIAKNQTPAQRSRSNFIFFALIITAVFLGAALVAVGIISHKHAYDKESD